MGRTFKDKRINRQKHENGNLKREAQNREDRRNRKHAEQALRQISTPEDLEEFEDEVDLT